MDFQAIVISINRISEQIDNCESGDLMAVLDIKSAYLDLRDDIAESIVLRDIAKFTDMLSRVCISLSMFGLEHNTRKILVEANANLKALFNKEKPGNEIATQINSLANNIQDILKNYSRKSNYIPTDNSIIEEEVITITVVEDNNEIPIDELPPTVDEVEPIIEETQTVQPITVVEDNNKIPTDELPPTVDEVEPIIEETQTVQPITVVEDNNEIPIDELPPTVDEVEPIIEETQTVQPITVEQETVEIQETTLEDELVDVIIQDDTIIIEEDEIIQEDETVEAEEPIESVQPIEQETIEAQETPIEEEPIESVQPIEQEIIEIQETTLEDELVDVIIQDDTIIIEEDEIIQEDETVEADEPIESVQPIEQETIMEDDLVDVIIQDDTIIIEEDEIIQEDETVEADEPIESVQPIEQETIEIQETPIEDEAIQGHIEVVQEEIAKDDTKTDEYFSDETISNSFENIVAEVDTFMDGDLAVLVEIMDFYHDLADSLSQLKTLSNISDLADEIVEVAGKLSNSEEIFGAQTVLRSVNIILRQFFEGDKTIPETAIELEQIFANASDIIKSNIEENSQVAEVLSSEAKTEIITDNEVLYEKEFSAEEINNMYGKDYFSKIVKDRNMLIQLNDEVKEHLDRGQFTLLELENNPINQENINKVFRSFHTIKGSSSFLGLKNIESVGHVMESLLVLIRDGKMKIDINIIDVIFEGIDILRSIANIMENVNFDIAKMEAEFRTINIFTYMDLLKMILEGYRTKRISDILSLAGWQGRIANKILSEEESSDTVVVERKSSASRKVTYVRVSNYRLNSLIDLVGELVINQSMLKQAIELADSEGVGAERSISQLESITTNMKNLVLSMGMVPIADVFNRLRVVIRNTAAELQKEVNVEISGKDTELDRNVVQFIYDPMVHIVRNSLDHGIETPDERMRLGKSRAGIISIVAQHKGNGIEITVSDDGRGINREKIAKKAIDLGLVEASNIENMSNKEVFAFMFHPGFSTADKVTEVSGRGVGLDVVKKNIDELRGRVEVVSEEGKFTKFIVKLPLTLAIIEGFIITVGVSNYVLPFNSIESIVVPDMNQVSILDDGSMMLFYRKIYVPLIFAGEVFGEKEYKKINEQALVVIVAYENNYYGIVVDSVIGKQETVIKNLGESLQNLSLFSGGTIFGDGTIGFVVDLEGFLEAARKYD